MSHVKTEIAEEPKQRNKIANSIRHKELKLKLKQ